MGLNTCYEVWGGGGGHIIRQLYYQSFRPGLSQNSVNDRLAKAIDASDPKNPLQPVKSRS